MPRRLKEEIWERLSKRGEELGIQNLPDMIADETSARTEEEVIAYIAEKNHPCISMDPMI